MTRALPSCPSCLEHDAKVDALKAEIEWLRGELGMVGRAEERHRLKVALDLTGHEARIALRLYHVKGKLLSLTQLEDELDDPGKKAKHCEHEGSNIIAVYCTRLRKKLGPDVIEVVPRCGVRLTPWGMLTIRKALEGQLRHVA